MTPFKRCLQRGAEPPQIFLLRVSVFSAIRILFEIPSNFDGGRNNLFFFFFFFFFFFCFFFFLRATVRLIVDESY